MPTDPNLPNPLQQPPGAPPPPGQPQPPAPTPTASVAIPDQTQEQPLDEAQADDL